MNLLLTGCAGFIGMNFLRCLVSKKHQYLNIVSVDKLGYASHYNIPSYFKLCEKNKIEHITVDLSNIKKIPILKGDEKWDILNFASNSHVDNSIKDPNAIFNENSKIPGGIIQIIGMDNINKFIHISTDEVYSEIPLNKIDQEEFWFKEVDRIIPNNPYSASKAAQDCYLMAMRHTFGLNVKFIRMANQMPGEFQHPEKLLPASILRVINGEPIKIYGDGLNVRQWTPVEITSEIIYDALVGKIDDCFYDNVLHIANKCGLRTNNEIILLLEKILIENNLTVEKEFIEDRKGHDTAYALTTQPRINEYFDNCSLEESLDNCVKYFLKNIHLF